jgi:biotin transport system ATP-binding protein
MVPREGLEPSRLAAPDFESGASTSSTTPARGKPASIPAMNLRSISLERGGRPVFQSLSLALPEPRIGLIGVNGSGKSSLLRLIKGLLKPSGGSLDVQPSAGFVFQNTDHQLLFPTVMEELCFGLLEQGQSQAAARQAAESLLEKYQALHLKDSAVHDLSDGQKQLLCILSVLMDQPSVLLFDEPFSSLDLPTTRQLMAIIAALPQQCIMATHDLNLLKDFDRVIWLDRGSVKMDGTPADVVLSYQQAYQ